MGATCGGPLAGWHLTAPSPACCATASPGPHMGPRSPASTYLPRGPQGLLQVGGALGVQGWKERGEVRPGAHCTPLEGGARGVTGQKVGGWLGAGVLDPTYLPPGPLLQWEPKGAEGREGMRQSLGAKHGAAGKGGAPGRGIAGSGRSRHQRGWQTSQARRDSSWMTWTPAWGRGWESKTLPWEGWAPHWP